MALDLSSAPTAPPRASRGKRVPSKPSTGSVSQTILEKREEGAKGIFQLAGFGLIVTKQYADAGAIAKHGANISHELAALADKNDGVAKLLDYFTEAGPYAGLVAAVMPFALQIMANHNMIRADMVSGAGVVSPDALTAQIQAEMAKERAEALKAQQEAEMELAFYQQHQVQDQDRQSAE